MYNSETKRVWGNVVRAPAVGRCDLVARIGESMYECPVSFCVCLYTDDAGRRSTFARAVPDRRRCPTQCMTPVVRQGAARRRRRRRWVLDLASTCDWGWTPARGSACTTWTSRSTPSDEPCPTPRCRRSLIIYTTELYVRTNSHRPTWHNSTVELGHVGLY